MNPTIASAVLSGAVLVIVAVITNRANRKGAVATNALAERVVDREDFQVIVDELRESLTDVRAELAQVKRDLMEEITARRQAEKRADEAEEAAAQAHAQTAELERRVTQLEQENAELRDKLSVATRLLGDKYPDE